MLLPYHLCCQKVKERETSSKVATPVYWADDGDQRALSIGCGGANINTLVFFLLDSAVSSNQLDVREKVTHNDNECMLLYGEFSWVDVE